MIDRSFAALFPSDEPGRTNALGRYRQDLFVDISRLQTRLDEIETSDANAEAETEALRVRVRDLEAVRERLLQRNRSLLEQLITNGIEPRR